MKMTEVTSYFIFKVYLSVCLGKLRETEMCFWQMETKVRKIYKKFTKSETDVRYFGSKFDDDLKVILIQSEHKIEFAPPQLKRYN